MIKFFLLYLSFIGMFLFVGYSGEYSSKVMVFLAALILFDMGIAYSVCVPQERRKSKNEEYFDSLRKTRVVVVDSPEKLVDFVEENAVDLFNEVKERMIEKEGWKTDA